MSLNSKGKASSIFVFLLVSLATFAQDLSGVFDDDSDKLYFANNNQIKLNFAPLLHGELPITYERRLGDYFSIETGIGIQLPYIVPDIAMYSDEYTDFRTPELTFHYWLAPKLYFLGDALDHFYIGLQMRKKHYELWAGEVYFTDYSILYGACLQWTDHFYWDWNLGYGMRIVDDRANDIYESGFTIALAFKLGYAF